MAAAVMLWKGGKRYGQREKLRATGEELVAHHEANGGDNEAEEAGTVEYSNGDDRRPETKAMKGAAATKLPGSIPSASRRSRRRRRRWTSWCGFLSAVAAWTRRRAPRWFSGGDKIERE